MSLAAVLVYRNHRSSHHISVAWNLIWRALVASLCCGIGGILLGVTLGIIISLNEIVPNLASWREILAAYSNVFGILLTELPV